MFVITRSGKFMKLKLCDIIIHCTSLTRLHILYSIRLCGNHWILLELSGLELVYSHTITTILHIAITYRCLRAKRKSCKNILTLLANGPTSKFGTRHCKEGLKVFFIGHHRPCIYTLHRIAACNKISQALILITCLDTRILRVAKAWEQC